MKRYKNVHINTEKKETPEIKEVSFTAEVTVDDLNDIDF